MAEDSMLADVEEIRSGVLLTGEVDSEVADYVFSRQKDAGYDIWACTKEIFFEQADDFPVLHYRSYFLDNKTLELLCMHGLSSHELTEEEMLHSLAMALLHRIPVYPNSTKDERSLAEWHRRLLHEGFKTTVDGKELHFHVGPKIVGNRDRVSPDSLSARRMISPAELLLVREKLDQRLAELSAAQLMLDQIDAAIAALEAILLAKTRNENAIQECITTHPILFGPEYRRLIPKHKLGSEYELDYALERQTGLIDLVELESSTLELYTKSGDPRAPLVHAEQQILDWLEWIQAHGDYARHKLSGIHRPRGFVVIGRRASLNEQTSRKLEQRNRLLGDFITLLTYDDLLDRARDLRGLLANTELGVTGPSVAPDR